MPRTDTQTGRRVSVDLTPAAAAEIDRLREITGLATADIFRHALALVRLYVNAKSTGKELIIIEPSNLQSRTQIELPMEIARSGRR